MKDNGTLIKDVRDLHDDVLIRKIIECRRQVKALERYPEEEVVLACANLKRAVARMEDEIERRSLPIEDIRSFADGNE